MDGSSKKLTLEERLSQAAQKGKRRTRKQNSSSAAASPTPSQLIETKNVELDDSSNNNKAGPSDLEGEETKNEGSQQAGPEAEENLNEDSLPDGTDSLLSIIKTEPWSSWLPADDQFLEPLSLLKLLDPHVKELIKQNAQAAKPDSSASSLVKVIKEKEEIIGQLRKEGEKLSKTELRQGSTIKALNNTIKQSKEEIEILQKELVEKLERLDERNSEKKELLKKIRDLEDQIKELNESQVDVGSLKSQLAESESQLNEVRASLNAREKDFSDVETKLRNEINSLRSTSQEEITSLESNLEQLRIELEVSKKGLEKGGHDSHIQEQYNFLRKELESNRENWTTLEDVLNGKIAALEARVTQADKAKAQLIEELASTNKANEALQQKIDEAAGVQTTNQKTIEKLESKNKSLSVSLDDIKDDYKLLQKQYNVQKTHLEHRIDSSENIPRRSSTAGREGQIAEPVKFEDDWLLPSMISSIEDSEPPMELKDKLTNNGFDSPRLGKEDMELEINDMPNEASELPSAPRTGISRQYSSSNNIHKLGSEVPISNQMSAQMVSKLAAEIRRFEVEVSSLKGQCDRAQKEKTTANHEIVRLLEENERLKTLEQEKLGLAKEVDELHSKLETSLQILGEKSERTEELENDVEDLKEMMKQQIQDMIGLQTKNL